MSENAIGDTKPGGAPRYTKRRLSDEILTAFHQACDQGDLEVAERLAGILDMMRLFDVSSGKLPVEQVADRCPDQIDDAREGCGVSITSGSCPSGLEQAVEGLQPGVGMA
jgi:hypothetical protein